MYLTNASNTISRLDIHRQRSRDAFEGKAGVEIVLAVVRPDHLADVRGRGVRVWQRARIDQGNRMPSTSELQGRARSKHACPDDDDVLGFQ